MRVERNRKKWSG